MGIRNQRHESIRFDEAVEPAVSAIAENTGWSRNKVVNLVARVGLCALCPGSWPDGTVTGGQEFLRAAVAHHTVELKSKQMLGRTGRAMRDARKKLSGK